MGLIPAGNGHLKPSRPRLVPARPKVCTSQVREPLRFPKNVRFPPVRSSSLPCLRRTPTSFRLRALQGYLAHKKQGYFAHKKRSEVVVFRLQETGGLEKLLDAVPPSNAHLFQVASLTTPLSDFEARHSISFRFRALPLHLAASVHLAVIVHLAGTVYLAATRAFGKWPIS